MTSTCRRLMSRTYQQHHFWTKAIVILLVGTNSVTFWTTRSVATLTSSPITSPGAELPYDAPVMTYISQMKNLNKLRRGYSPTREKMSGILNSYWWNDKDIPEAFLVSKLDDTYTKQYFTAERGHPLKNTGYVTHVANLIPLILGRPLKSVVELGNGGGFFAKKFFELGYDVVTVEGNRNGFQQTLDRGLPPERVVQHDLRMPLFLGRRFDVALCTEVVEHVEPAFSSSIILNIILHSDVVWFSNAEPGDNKQSWIDHPNERPLKMWQALFDFYDYDIILLPAQVKKEAANRGTLVAYNRSNPTLTPDALRDHLKKQFK